MHRIGYLQFEPGIRDVAGNCRKIESMIAESDDWDLLVIPELASSGYAFISGDEMKECAEVAGKGPFTTLLLNIALERKAYLVGGFPEKAGDTYYNSCLLAGPEGLCGLYRKAHLFMNEKNLFSPGDLDFPVIETRIGRIGMLICFDWAFPEAWRILALKGADIIAHPSNLVTPYAQQAVPVHALVNGVWVVTANRIGTERGIPFSGRSFISSSRGQTLAMAEPNNEVLYSIEADISLAADKMITSGNHLLDDRRPHLYRDINR